MILDLADLKAHLAVEHDEDDTLLTAKIAAAQAHVEAFVGSPLDVQAAPDLKEAVRLLAGHLYENREASVVDGTVKALPLGFHDLLAPHRVWSF
ncbi:MAG: head-tail connector protein [Salinarimonas sp.]